MRRRRLLKNLALTAAVSAAPSDPARAQVPGASPGELLEANLRDALLRTATADRYPLSRPDVARGLTRAFRDFQACRYERLATDLPRVVAGAEALAADGGARAYAQLTETYTLVIRLLIKLDRTELGLLAADRARVAAESSNDPILLGEAARNLSVLTRKAGWHEQATQIAMSAAAHPGLRRGGSAFQAQRGLLIMSAAYTAAKAQDRGGMRELTNEAMAIATSLEGRVVSPSHGGGFGAPILDLHLVSAYNACGDPTAALAVARGIDARALPTVERRSRFYGDVAAAWALRGRRAECLDALLAAERQAPQEAHARPAIRKLVGDLLIAGRVSPDLSGLAMRCGLT